MFHLVVRNVSLNAAEQVVVRNRLPAGVKLINALPKPAVEGSLLTWELGTLQPRQEKRLDLQLSPEGKGDYACQASVTSTGTMAARFVVREPKIVVKLAAPQDKVLVGDSATLNLTVSNIGDGAAMHVQAKTLLPDGLQHAGGKVIEFDIGTLAAKESRSVQVVCTSKTAGEYQCTAVAVADGNLKAQAKADVIVVVPHIDLSVTGPRLRYLERPAAYVIKVANPGTCCGQQRYDHRASPGRLQVRQCLRRRPARLGGPHRLLAHW